MTQGGSIVLTGGGTGGHVMPALAVADAFQKCAPHLDIHYVGGSGSMEEALVREHGLPFHGISVHPFFGKPLPTRIKAIFSIPPALITASSILRKVQARVTMAFGGYVSAAVGLVAPYLGIPLVLQEQNSVPGRTTRLLSRKASLICLGFPDVKESLNPQILTVTGNPVRSDIEAIGTSEPSETDPLKLLIMGGSQGALFLNTVGPNVAGTLQAQRGRTLVHHQCGRHEPGPIKAAYEQLGIEAHVEPFINDMASAYEKAHIALARAGALSVAELWNSNTPSVFVPFPYATDDHQYQNAQYMAETGAAQVIRQENASELALADALASLLASHDDYLAKRETLRKTARLNSSNAIAEAALALIDNPGGDS